MKETYNKNTDTKNIIISKEKTFKKLILKNIDIIIYLNDEDKIINIRIKDWKKNLKKI